MSQLNIRLFEWIYGFAHRSFLIDGIGVFLANYLPYLMVIGLLAAIAAQETLRRRLALLSELILAVLLSRGILTELIRFIHPVQRPFDALGFTPLIGESGSSFPSGHAAFFFACALVIFFINKKWGVLLFVLTCVNALARIYAGVHWPADIAGGIIVGILSALAVHLVLRPYIQSLSQKDFPQKQFIQ